MTLVSQKERADIFGDTGGGVVAAGTTQATAAMMTGSHEAVTSATADGQGIILKNGNREDIRSVSNKSAFTIIVYPAVGGSFNGGPTNTGVTLPAQRAAIFFYRSATDITAVF